MYVRLMALRLMDPNGRPLPGQCAVHSRVRVVLPEWRINCRRAWAALLQLWPPPGECRTILQLEVGGRLRWDGRPVRCRDARIGPLPPSKGGPRHWQARGPAVRFSRWPASARWIGQAPGPGLPAWAAPSRTSKRGCAVRSGLSKGPWQVAGEHSFVRGLGGFARKDNDGQLHWRL